jgi:hypothetical protein
MNRRNLRWLVAGVVIAVAAAAVAALARRTWPCDESTDEAAEAELHTETVQPAAP